MSECLRELPSIRGLAPDHPGQSPAILRQLILPVVLDALGAPRSEDEWAQWFHRGGFDARQKATIDAYLNEHRARFDLFDEVSPFGQVAGLHTANDETKPAAALVAPLASGNNVPLFSAYTDADDLELTPDEALAWMLYTQCWDTAGIKAGAVGDDEAKNNKSFGNRTGPLGALGVVAPTGENLFQTVLLNLPIVPDGLDPKDAPQWRRDLGPAWQERHARGYLDLFTWQSRRVRLLPVNTPRGVRVNQVVLTGGDRLAGVPDYEPHTLWRTPPKGAKGEAAVQRPRRHTAGKAAWRGLDALLALERPSDGDGVIASGLIVQIRALRAEEYLPDDYPLNVDILGVEYGTQSSIVENTIHDSLPLPVAALATDSLVRDALLEVAHQADRLEGAVNNLAADLRRAAGGDPVPWDKGQRPGEQVIHALDPAVRRLLTGLRVKDLDDDVIETRRETWERFAYQAASSTAEALLAVLPPDTFGGHEAGGRTYRAATAESNFKRVVRDILPRATPGTHENGR